MQRIKNIFLEDEAVTGNIKKASDFKYMRILRFHLNIMNVWPSTKSEGSKYRLLINLWVFTLNMFCLFGGIHYLKINWDTLSFYKLGHMYIILLMTIVCSSRTIITFPHFTKYTSVGILFIKKMHLLYFKEASEYAMKTYKKVNTICHLFTLYLTVQMFAALCLFNIIPMWNNYSSGKYNEKILYNSTYEHCMYLSMGSLKIYTHFDAYVFACLLFWVIAYLCCISFCMLDLLLSLMVFNIWGHFKILIHDLETFPMPIYQAVTSTDNSYATDNVEMYSKEELILISEKLKRCIDYHRLISDFTDKMSEAFGPMLLVYYGFHQVSGCLLLLESSQMMLLPHSAELRSLCARDFIFEMTAEALLRYVPLSVILFQQLIQLSVIFELVGSTSEKLNDAVYSVPWQYMDTKNRRIVAIFLYFVREPIHLKAMGIVNVGVTTMATILKTSLSYFAFLYSLK